MLQASFARLFKPLSLLGFSLLFAANATAKLIDADALILQIVNFNKEVVQAELIAQVQIFDPEALRPLDAELDHQAEPQALTDRGYTQRILIVRDEFLSIESKDKGGKLLHLKLEQDNRILNKNYQPKRLFSSEDILFEHALFYTKYDQIVANGLGSLGIPNAPVKMVFEQGQLYYRLGSDEEYLLVSPSEFRVEKMQRTLEINGRLFPVEIEFSHWDNKLKRIPQRIRYSLNGRLFKEVHLTEINFTNIGSKMRVLQKNYAADFKESIPIETIPLVKIDLKENPPPKRKRR